LRAHEQEFQAAGASLAAIGLGDAKHASFFQEEMGFGFPLLIDENREAYRAAGLKSANLFHIFRPENAIAGARAKAAGHSQTGVGKNPFQLGGSFVFAPGNRDIFVHVSQTFGDNATPAALLKAVTRVA
jgi:cold shock CspA family protein